MRYDRNHMMVCGIQEGDWVWPRPEFHFPIRLRMRWQLTFVPFAHSNKACKFRFKCLSRLCGTHWVSSDGDIYLTFEKFRNDTCAWLYQANQTDLLTQTTLAGLESQEWRRKDGDDKNEEILTFLKFRKRSDFSAVIIEHIEDSSLLGSLWRRDENPQNIEFKTVGDNLRAVMFSDENPEAKLSFDFDCLIGTIWDQCYKRKAKCDVNDMTEKWIIYGNNCVQKLRRAPPVVTSEELTIYPWTIQIWVNNINILLTWFEIM